jgi:hypothetical protein
MPQSIAFSATTVTHIFPGIFLSLNELNNKVLLKLEDKNTCMTYAHSQIVSGAIKSCVAAPHLGLMSLMPTNLTSRTPHSAIYP